MLLPIHLYRLFNRTIVVDMQSKFGHSVLLHNVLLLLQQEYEYVGVRDHSYSEPQVPDALVLLSVIHLGELELFLFCLFLYAE